MLINEYLKKIKKTINIKKVIFAIYILMLMLVIIILKPYATYKKLKAYAIGDSSETTTLMEKIKNDLNIKPYRQLVSYTQNSDLSQYKEITNLSLKPRRENPKILLKDNALPGYRLIYGVFDFADHLHGAILLGEKGNVVHTWKITQNGDSKAAQSDTNIFPHGLEIAHDGSIITAFGGGSTLTKYDYCGNIIWRIYGLFHHAISFGDDNKIWVLGNVKNNKNTNLELLYSNVLEVDYKTGQVLKNFSIEQIMKANPEIDIFGVLQVDNPDNSEWVGENSKVYWHPNDVEPLPAKWADKYPNFLTGDLLISLRSPDLIFVIDPNTLKVKWWRQGLTRRQHDPDWNEFGTITILNNNMHRQYSNIVEINPATYEYNTPVKGEEFNFYTWIRGKQQILPDRSFLITSTQQGRVFEVNKNNKITFEFLNTYDSKLGENLALSEAKFLPLDFFTNLPSCD